MIENMYSKNSSKTTVIVYLVSTFFLIAFNAIYSLFGHGVTSPYMSFAFAFSLVLGVGSFILLGILKLANRIAYNLYNAGIATLTVGSVLRGIIEIAGADTIYPSIYFLVGTLFVVTGSLIYLSQWIQTRNENPDMDLSRKP